VRGTWRLVNAHALAHILPLGHTFWHSDAFDYTLWHSNTFELGYALAFALAKPRSYD
jgi:hypothetical protein